MGDVRGRESKVERMQALSVMVPYFSGNLKWFQIKKKKCAKVLVEKVDNMPEESKTFRQDIEAIKNDNNNKWKCQN